MSGEERAPSFERPDPLGDPIVELLVDKRCGRWVDRGKGRFRLPGHERFIDDDVELIKPFELVDAFEAQRPMEIRADRKPERENNRVFEKLSHATASEPRPSESCGNG
jgi:hypothetical protein